MNSWAYEFKQNGERRIVANIETALVSLNFNLPKDGSSEITVYEMGAGTKIGTLVYTRLTGDEE